MEQGVQRNAAIDERTRALHSDDRQQCRREHAKLDEDRGLIPVQVLVRHFVAIELDDDQKRYLDPPAGGWNARKHPVHPDVVSETEDNLFDDPPLADGPRYRDHLRVLLNLGHEKRL